MLLGVTEAMTEKGFVESVADILQRAGVSRETFYQQFSSKLDCFMAVFDTAAEILFADCSGRSRRPAPPSSASTAPSPPTSTPWRPSPATPGSSSSRSTPPDRAAVERRTAVQRRIVEVLVDVLEVKGERGHFACEVLVAAISSMVTGPLVADDLDALRALREPIVDLVGHTLSL